MGPAYCNNADTTVDNEHCLTSGTSYGQKKFKKDRYHGWEAQVQDTGRRDQASYQWLSLEAVVELPLMLGLPLAIRFVLYQNVAIWINNDVQVHGKPLMDS